MNIKTYSELITLPTFEERYLYLRLGGKVGEDTLVSIDILIRYFIEVKNGKQSEDKLSFAITDVI